MAVFIPTTTPPDFSRSFARTMQQSVAPALELQFFVAQNAVQDRMDKDIEKLLAGGESTAGATAHWTRKLAAIEPKLAVLQPFAERAAANKDLLTATLDALSELRALADPSSVAAFDAKRTATLDLLSKMRTAGEPPLGMIKDGLGPERTAAIATLDGIVTNNFIAPADVAAAQSAIDALTLALTDRLVLVQLAEDTATGAVSALTKMRASTQAEIDQVEVAADAALEKKVEDARSYYGRIMTIMSLSLEGAIAITSSFNDSLNPVSPPRTGTVVDYMA